jgi:hypothetical protein
MKITFSASPGARERQLQRRHDNPLFAERGNVTSGELDEARNADAQEREEFYQEFQKILQEIADFSGQVESEKILEAKQKIDQMHEQACGLAGENQQVVEGLVRLQAMIMQAIAHGAQGDSKAVKELEEEAAARELHQQLLQHKLVCDLLRPDTPIGRDELAATILTADEDSVRAALVMFQPDMLQSLIESCESLLAGLEGEGIDTTEARSRLQLLLDARAAQAQ